MIADVQDGFMDGLALISLIEVLSGTDLKVCRITWSPCCDELDL